MDTVYPESEVIVQRGATVRETSLAELEFDPRNANRGTDRGREALRHSLSSYGAGRSILLDKNGRILAGNKTAEQAALLGHESLIVVETDGSKLVAVKRVDLDGESPEGRALALADNRVGELDLSYDPAILSEALADGIDLSSLWTGDELEELLAGLTEPSGLLEGAGPDAIPEEVEPRTTPGDLWALGRHRLLCGDSTKSEDVERLLSGETPRLMVTLCSD